jgi:hypothetical protein
MTKTNETNVKLSVDNGRTVGKSLDLCLITIIVVILIELKRILLNDSDKINLFDSDDSTVNIIFIKMRPIFRLLDKFL